MRVHLFIEADEATDTKAVAGALRAALPGRNDWVSEVEGSTYGRGLSINLLSVEHDPSKHGHTICQELYNAWRAIGDLEAKAYAVVSQQAVATSDSESEVGKEA